MLFILQVSILSEQTLGATRDPPPSSPAHLKGGQKKKKKTQEAKLPKKFPRKREVEGAEGTEPEGREDVLHKKNTSTVPPEPKT